MAERVTPQLRGSYGIDAPYGPAFMAVVAVLELVLAILSGRVGPFLAFLFILAILGFYLHTTLRGKFIVWADLLDKLNLRGDERILDLGCGRGAVLLMAAQHLTTGRAVGIDLWKWADQSGNSAGATQRNAIAEGVADRVELHTGDIRALPFEDNTFDVVVSSLAIHNISGRAGREQAIDEAMRVLRPGGRLMIADVRGTGRHKAQLARIGMSDVTRRRLGWQFWVSLVTATKPELRASGSTSPPRNCTRGTPGTSGAS
jgi:ubiquinone/menaquinone biosynthesis C-methylase UbiE